MFHQRIRMEEAHYNPLTMPVAENTQGSAGDTDRGTKPPARGQDETGHPSHSLLDQLRQNLPLLSPAERQIGEYVLEYPRQVLRLPTDQLAKEIGVSQGTLSNFSQALGYNGFKAFRLDLAAEVNTSFACERAACRNASGDAIVSRRRDKRTSPRRSS